MLDCSLQKLGLSQCDDIQSQAEWGPGGGLPPRTVETSQALRAIDRNGTMKVVFGCSREPGVLWITID